MHIIALFCGCEQRELPAGDNSVVSHNLPEVPGQRDLAFLKEVAAQFLPVDTTPSLDEIQRQPDVKPQGAPEYAPQQPTEAVRLIVVGNDAALSAVITRLMRADSLWMQIAFAPTGESIAAQNWQLTGTIDEAICEEVHPVPLIRDDAGVAVAGSATVTEWDNNTITGEIIVDDHVLLAPDKALGARLVPTTDAPGLAAVRIERRLWRTRLNETSLSTGRALQVGGLNLRITVDGISRRRPVDKATFYRHLRDLQIVRPARPRR